MSRDGPVRCDTRRYRTTRPGRWRRSTVWRVRSLISPLTDYFSADEELAGIAREAGKTLVDLSLQWLLSQSQVDSVILGASRPSQLAENLKVCEGGGLEQAVLLRCDEAWKRLRGATPKYNR